jgi:hypothetical protein
MENRTRKLPHRRHYYRKVFRNLFAALLVLSVSLFLGIAGYRLFFGLSWMDSLYNASMILNGMGPVDTPPNNSAKVFASLYAIFSGVAFLTSVAIIFSPIVHRFLHRFRIDVEE